MGKKDDLHGLIHSMTMNEKRYFRIFTSRQKGKGQQNYLRLFAVVEAMETFDADRLKEHFKGETLGKYLSSEKNYLYRSILKSIRAYRSENSPAMQLQEMLVNMEILESKGLYDAFEKEMRRAIKLASRLGDPYSVLNLIERQIKWRIFRARKNMEEEVEALIKERAVLVDQVQKSNRVLSLYDRYMAKARVSAKREIRNSALVTPEEMERIQHIPKERLTPRAQTRRESLFFLLARRKGDMKTAFVHAEKVVQIFSQYPQMIKMRANSFKVALANYIGAALFISRFDLLPALFIRIHELPATNFNAEAELFQNVFFYELVWKMNIGDLKAAEALVPAIEAGLEKFSAKVNRSRKLGFLYNIAVVFFFRSNWRQAYRWVRLITQGEKTDHRQDLQQFAGILELILLAELAEFELLEYRLLNVRRTLRERGSLILFDKIVIGCMKEILANREIPHDRTWWEKQEATLEEWKQSLGGHPPVGVEETLLWMKSKTLGISLETALENVES